MKDMTIFCSNLPNDQDLIAELGEAARPMTLFTDACFSGVDENGGSILVAVERKRIHDLAVCMNNNRLMHQIEIARDHGADVYVLVVEGLYRSGSGESEGLLMAPVGWFSTMTAVRPFVKYDRFIQYLAKLTYLVGVIVLHTENVTDTARAIKAVYSEFQTPPSEHKSFHKFYTPPGLVPLSEPGLVRRVAKELPGVGWNRSQAVAERFSSVAEMCAATIGDWKAIPGIGAKLARSCHYELNGGKLHSVRSRR